MSILVVDGETDGLFFKDLLVSIAFTSTNNSTAFAVNHPEMEHTEQWALKRIQKLINRCTILVGHNLQFDLEFLIYNGINIPDNILLVDTQILYWLYTGHREKSKSLNDISKILLNKNKVEGLDFKVKKASEYPLKELLHYNEVDTQLTYECYKKLVNKIPTQLVKFYSNTMRMFVDMRMNGIFVNQDLLNSIHIETATRLEKLQQSLLDMLEYPINMGSSQQLSCALYGGTFMIKGGGTEEVERELKGGRIKKYTRKCDLSITLKGLGFGTSKLKRNKTGFWPTSDDVILKLKGRSKKAKEWIKTYREYNKLSTLFTKYITKFKNHVKEDTSLLHGNYHLCNTMTGRTSCSDPNVQNFPRDVKGMPNLKVIFTSRFANGVILDVDFSGAEWRHAAWRSQCRQMIQDIIDGLDPHTTTAMGFHKCHYDDVTKEQRQDAKPINFRFLYGGTPLGFYLSDIVTSVKEGQIYVDGIYARFPGLYKSHMRDKAIAKGTGKLVMDSGRWYDYKGPNYKDSKVLNYPNQGSSSDMTLICLYIAHIEVKKAYGEDVLLINSVHDCGVWDCKSEEIALGVHKIVSNIFLNAHKYVSQVFPKMDLSSVPMDSESEMGKSWGEMTLIKEEV